MSETTLKGFDKPDELREFPNGRFQIVHVAGVSLGRATYQPGWKWVNAQRARGRHSPVPCTAYRRGAFPARRCGV